MMKAYIDNVVIAGKTFEFGDSYLKTIMGFIGVDMLDSIIAEGMVYDPTNAEAFKQAAIELSQQAASTLALV